MNTTQTANDAYRAARERLDERLNMVNRLVRAHDARQFRDRENWSHVERLTRLNEILDEAIEFLGGSRGETAP